MKLLIVAAALCAVTHGASYGVVRESQSEEANYNFAWSVSDPESYVYTSQKESRNGDSTQGEYTLVEEDGSIRKVTYEVNGDSGFTAVVNGVKFPQDAPADPNAGNGGSQSQQGAAKPKPKPRPAPAPAPAPAPQRKSGSSGNKRNGGGGGGGGNGSSSVSIQTPSHSVSY